MYKIGVAVRTPTLFEISETFTDDGRSQFDPNPSTGVVDRYSYRVDNATNYRIRTPLVLSGGASLQAFDWLLLAGDAEYTDWTQLEFDTNNPDLLDENRRMKNELFRATTNLRGGAEITLWDVGLKLRGGISYLPSPYKGDPKERDQLYYTAGFGVLLDANTSINASYSIGTWKTFNDNYYLDGLAAPSRTNEQVNTNTMSVSLVYRF